MATGIVLALAALFILYVAYDIGRMNGEMKGWKRTGHARTVHMQDLCNIHAILVRKDDPEGAGAYIRDALSRIECSPSKDQQLPERI